MLSLVVLQQGNKVHLLKWKKKRKGKKREGGNRQVLFQWQRIKRKQFFRGQNKLCILKEYHGICSFLKLLPSFIQVRRALGLVHATTNWEQYHQSYWKCTHIKHPVFETFQSKYKYQIICISTEIRLEKKSIKLYHQCFLLLKPKSVIKQTQMKRDFILWNYYFSLPKVFY